ncbi:MAG TPA: hypothetical protein VMW28_01225, partial [Pelolinea sp.]|nr:hypothetical protein [Pelolinea sp.]
SVIKSAHSTDTILLGGLALDGDCAFHPIPYLQALNDNDAWYAFDALSLELPALNDSPETVQVDTCGYAPVQSSGKPLADALRGVDDIVRETGAKPVWVHGLAFTADFLSAKSTERGTLPEVAESDYMARASAIVLAEGGVDKVFWRYDPQAGAPGAIAMQSFSNLSRTLGGSYENSGAYMADSGIMSIRFRGSGKLSALTWRSTGGDDFIPAVIPGFESYNLHAWSADAASLKSRDGIELPVDAGGSVALMVSERPVIISGKPDDLKQSLTLFLADSAAQAGKGLQGKLASWAQAQKAKAAEKVGAWVDEQQQSLMDMLKTSFNQWLRKSLGLAKL